jgi:CBS domain-containing protein
MEEHAAMKVSDIMTKEVVSVAPDTPVKEIAELMTWNRISGVPVVNKDGKLAGIVSETDLLHRTETGTERKRKWFLGMFQDADTLAREFVKSHGLCAADIMTKKVTTIDANADLGAAADYLDKNKLKRVPIVDGGKLVGILTRGDLVRALAQATLKPADGTIDDVALEKEIRARLKQAKWLETTFVNVRVAGGAAELFGMVSSADQRKALAVLVGETPGVKKVDDKMVLRPANVTT